MSKFLQHFEAGMTSRRLIPAGAKVLVAVSGGMDSMVLLHLLNGLAAKNRWKLRVAHFNHQLRGRASDADEKLVRREAERLKLPIAVGRADVKVAATKDKISVEMAARQLRHEFLARTARQGKIGVIALAHHADDQVELFFLRLLRGAGGEGAAGMKWRSPSFVDKTIMLVRPFLDIPKSELEVFACGHHVRFRVDGSNSSNDFLRNRIRNELLPLLRDKYQPGLTKTVLRLMDITGAESEFVQQAALKWSAGRKGKQDGTFAKLPVAVQRKVLLSQLSEAGQSVDFELVEQLRASAERFVSVNPGLTVARDAAGKLKFGPVTVSTFSDGECEVNLEGREGRAEFAGRVFGWRIQPQKRFAVPAKQAGRELFDADQVGGRIILRHWRAGDRFQPIGLKTATKLQDLFVNAKVPAAQRRELVLATTADGAIFWVEGLRIGERFKITPKTGQKLVWSH